MLGSVLAAAGKVVFKKQVDAATAKVAPVGKTWPIKGLIPDIRAFGRRITFDVTARVEE